MQFLAALAGSKRELTEIPYVISVLTPKHYLLERDSVRPKSLSPRSAYRQPEVSYKLQG